MTEVREGTLQVGVLKHSQHITTHAGLLAFTSKSNRKEIQVCVCVRARVIVCACVRLRVMWSVACNVC